MEKKVALKLVLFHTGTRQLKIVWNLMRENSEDNYEFSSADTTAPQNGRDPVNQNFRPIRPGKVSTWKGRPVLSKHFRMDQTPIHWVLDLLTTP